MEEKKAIEYFYEIDDLMKSLGLKYFLWYGTLLGAYRDSKFIPWDTDLDIGTFQEDINYEKLIKELEDRGFQWKYKRRKPMPPSKGVVGVAVKNEKMINCCIDAFERIDDYIYYRSVGDCAVFPKEEIENMRQIDFYGRKVNIPQNTEYVLEKLYGEWKQPIKSNHGSNYTGFNNNSAYKKPKDGDLFWWAK